MNMITGLDDQDSRNVTCSTWQLWFSLPFYTLFWIMLCFRSAMLVRSFTVNKISGTRHQPLFHAIRNIFVYVWVLPPIGIICKMCCPLLGHSFHSRSGIRDVVVREGENSIWPGRWSRFGGWLPDGRRLETVQAENTVRHTKYGRIRGMVVDEGGRSTGALLYTLFHFCRIAHTASAYRVYGISAYIIERFVQYWRVATLRKRRLIGLNDVTCVNIRRISNVCQRLQFSRCCRHTNWHNDIPVQCPLRSVREEVHRQRRGPRTKCREIDVYF